jgi:hypothetical protein
VFTKKIRAIFVTLVMGMILAVILSPLNSARNIASAQQTVYITNAAGQQIPYPVYQPYDGIHFPSTVYIRNAAGQQIPYTVYPPYDGVTFPATVYRNQGGQQIPFTVFSPNGTPTAPPSLYPALPVASSSPYPGGGAYIPPGGILPTLSAGFGEGVGLIGSGNVVGSVAPVGTLDGSKRCRIQMLVTNIGNGTPPPTIPTLNADGNEEGCGVGFSGSAGGIQFYPTDVASNSGVSKLNREGVTFTEWEMNGVIHTVDSNNVPPRQWRMSRIMGQTYTMDTGNGNGLRYYFNATTQTVAQALANAPAPYRPISNFLGAFYRTEGSPPFGMFAAGNASNQAPVPYPAPNPSNLFGAGGFCTTVATNGKSILTANPVDNTKIANLVALGVQWTRGGPSPIVTDYTHVVGDGTYHWAQWDAAVCAQLKNGITPTVNVDSGPVYYDTLANVNAGTANGQPTYKSPADYAAWGAAVAQHDQTYFGNAMLRYTIAVKNEVNTIAVPLGGGAAQSGLVNDPGFSDDMISQSNNPTLYQGRSGAILYQTAIYTAIKAVNPNIMALAGELNMDPASDPFGFITLEYASGLRLGNGFDGWSEHINPANHPLGTYDALDIGFQPGDSETIALVNGTNITTRNGGDNRIAPLLLGESCGFTTVPTNTNQYGNLADAVTGNANLFAWAERNPQIIGINCANLDENGNYLNTAFYGNAQINNLSLPPYQFFNPSTAILQGLTGISPSAPPTLSPGTTTATPLPAMPAMKTAILGLYPVAFYAMSEASGTVANDISGNTYSYLTGPVYANNFNGTYSSTGVTLNSAPISANDGDTGAPVFASPGYMTTGLPPDLSMFTGQSFWAVLWFNTTSGFVPFGNRLLANGHTDSDNTGIQVAFNGSANALVWNLATTVSGTPTVTNITTSPTTTFSGGTWFMLSMTYNGSQACIKLNAGTQTCAAATGNMIVAAKNLALGYNPVYSGDYFNGKISNAAFGQGTIPTDTQLNNVYNTGHP